MRLAFPLGAVVGGCLAAAALACAASAADLPNAPSSYPALNTDSGQAWNPWSGLYVGTDISAWGGKGVKGGVGADGFIGYDHAFDNGVVVGVQASSGYAPFLWATPGGFTQFTGTAYAGGEAKVGYRMGQITPYLLAGVDFARPTAFASVSAFDNVNAVFSGPGAVQAVGMVGMGATYQVTPNLAFGVEARMYKANVPNNPNPWLAPFSPPPY